MRVPSPRSNWRKWTKCCHRSKLIIQGPRAASYPSMPGWGTQLKSPPPSLGTGLIKTASGGTTTTSRMSPTMPTTTVSAILSSSKPSRSFILSEYQEEPWNSPAGANDGVEGSNMHQNAQSSLEVTMHDVDVQKRKRKRVALVSSDSESDTTNHPRKKNKRRRKKKPNRKQESRSINGVDAERQRIVKATFGPIQKAVTTRLPWATASPSGDPGADDDEIEDLIDEAWDAGCDHLDINPDDIPPRTPQESKLINARISQVRGAIVTVADIFVPASYGFTDLNSLADPTPDNIAKAREHNRQLVEDLVGTFMYPDPTQTDDLSTICHHSVFQKVLNAAFFAKKGMNHRNHYFADKDELPLETLALIMDAVVCAIDRWKTGEHQTVAFTAEVYAPFHRTTMEFLAKWYNEFERDIYPENVARKLLRDMLTNGRCLLGAPLETAPAPKAMFPMHIFGLN
ncbi:hypothetical protein C8R46DRAFT_354738 [Mycena filopes]|nr:hypothetical protein C8R46DRAFT_354738 [Mycena filopes]